MSDHLQSPPALPGLRPARGRSRHSGSLRLRSICREIYWWLPASHACSTASSGPARTADAGATPCPSTRPSRHRRAWWPPSLLEPGALPEVSAMRDGSARRQVMNGQPRTWTSERAEVQHFRRHHCDDLLQELADGARSVKWTRRLVTTLLDELHVSDEFDRLVGPLSRVAPASTHVCDCARRRRRASGAALSGPSRIERSHSMNPPSLSSAPPRGHCVRELAVGDDGRYFSFHEAGQFPQKSHGA